MKRCAVIFSALLIATTAMAAWFFVFRYAPRVSGPLRHEVYVWQRSWGQPVRDAVSQRATNFSALCLLKAEVSWKDKKPQVVRVSPDYAALRNVSQPVGLALRIGPYAGPFTPDVRSSGRESAQTSLSNNQSRLTSAATIEGEGITIFLTDLAASLVAEARTNQLPLSDLQIDFDSAESKLDGYRVWVEAIQRRVAPLPVTITALPSWLDSRAFKRLVTVATNYVLQVHSVERPKNPEAPFTLCDPRAANRAVERAGRIGVPFRVALPTYGYTLAFDKSGKFIGLSAEGPRPNWPADARLREVSSNPIELAALVKKWTASRPETMRGVIWYRLPVSTDIFNWRWPTLGAIVASRSLNEKLRCEPRRVEAGLVEISLVNEGELDISSRLAVEVRWTDARLVAADALRDFELADTSASAARFQTRTNSVRLPAGDSLKLGWLRLDRDVEVKCEVKRF